jgi:hypothetical protein
VHVIDTARMHTMRIIGVSLSLECSGRSIAMIVKLV